jgi:hypothetical protein
MSLRQRVGALIYDWPQYRRAMRSGRWVLIHNRRERITTDGRGVKCEWEFSSDLHIAKVFPLLGARIMRQAFAEWPITLRDNPPAMPDKPAVSFVIGHRGVSRLPHLLATLRSIAGQQDTAIECIVVEQSVSPEIALCLPEWVRYVHTPVPRADYDYNRAWTLNEGMRAARGEVVILHDNDMLVPAMYAAEAMARAKEGFDFLQMKRFTFYLDEGEAQHFFERRVLRTDVPSTIVQNLLGASIVAKRQAYFEIGGFDEEFVGWGGEDNEFWDRARAGGNVFELGYLPFVHLWHEPQKGKLQGLHAPAVKRYFDVRAVPPEERICRLRERLHP